MSELTDLSRREVIKKAMKLGGAVYVAPVVLAAARPVSVLAQVTPTPTGPTSPCSVATKSGGQGVTTTVHAMGRTSGTFTFSYNAFSIPDQFDVSYEGKIIYTTGAPVSGSNTVSITYAGASTNITVVVTGPQSGTQWEYTVNCPTAPA